MEAYGRFAYIYDQLMEDMPYSDWISFAQKVWDKTGTNPISIVDLGCGTGSITIPLAEMGYIMTGIDLSEDMLAVAHDKLEQLSKSSPQLRKAQVRLVQQDMTKWQIPEQVDCVISFCDCINYLLTESAVVQSFEATYSALRNGGSFIFDVHHQNTFITYNQGQPYVYDDEAISYIWTCDYEESLHQIEHNLSIFVQEGGEDSTRYRRFEEVHIQRTYSIEWIKQSLYDCGFKQVDCYSDFTEEPPTEETSRLFFVAIK
jgi:predicted TPR repeat methyltransferase